MDPKWYTNLRDPVCFVEVKDVGLRQVLDQEKLHLQSGQLLGEQPTVLPSPY